MTMQRRHFELIAEGLKSAADDRPWHGWSWDQHKMTCENVATSLASSNPLFNRDRFLRACGCGD